jgi:hypothetical protein
MVRLARVVGLQDSAHILNYASASGTSFLTHCESHNSERNNNGKNLQTIRTSRMTGFWMTRSMRKTSTGSSRFNSRKDGYSASAEATEPSEVQILLLDRKEM